MRNWKIRKARRRCGHPTLTEREIDRFLDSSIWPALFKLKIPSRFRSLPLRDLADDLHAWTNQTHQPWIVDASSIFPLVPGRTCPKCATEIMFQPWPLCPRLKHSQATRPAPPPPLSRAPHIYITRPSFRLSYLLIRSGVMCSSYREEHSGHPSRICSDIITRIAG